MKKSFALFAIALAAVLNAATPSTSLVYKNTTTNALTGNIVAGNNTTISASGTGTITATALTGNITGNPTISGNLTVSGGSIVNGAATSVYYFGTPSSNYLYYDGTSLFARVGGTDRLTISGSTGDATFSAKATSVGQLRGANVVAANLGTADTGFYGTAGADAGSAHRLALVRTDTPSGGSALLSAFGAAVVEVNATTGLNTGTRALTLDTSANATFAGNVLVNAGFAEITKTGTDLFMSTTAAGRGITFRTGAYANALTLDSSQNATFAGRVKAGTAYGTARSVEIDAPIEGPTNVTRTITVSLPVGYIGGTFMLEVGIYGNAGTGLGSLLVKGYGYFGDSSLYGVTEISKVSTGSVTVSSVTKANNQITFTVVNPDAAFFGAVKFSQTSDGAITTLPTITVN